MLPDVGIKAAQLFLKFAQNVATAVFTYQGCCSKWPQKSTNIWSTFVRKIVAPNLTNSPNLVTLAASDGLTFFGVTQGNDFFQFHLLVVVTMTGKGTSFKMIKLIEMDEQ